MAFKKRFVICLTLLLSSPAPAWALELEYYTYNGFGPIVNAFEKLALISTDGNYRALFFVIIVIAIVFGAAATYLESKKGGQNPLAWVIPILAGVIFYSALIVPTGTLHIYDPVKNQYQPVAGVPDGIVLIAGFLNMIERGLTDIVSVSGDPVGFQAQAGGVGFDMLFNLNARGVILADQYLHQSIRNYIKDCIFFELNRPGTTLTVNQFANNDNFLPLFDAAASPAIYTVFYNDATPAGISGDCGTVNTQIQAAITPAAQFDSSTRSRCAEAGFDPTIPAEFTTCKTLLTNLVNWLQGGVFSLTDVFRQFLIAKEIETVVRASSPDTAVQILGSRNTGTRMISSNIMANEWIPIIRAVATAMAIGIIPILIIFIPTPIFLRALGVIAGFFLWLTAWGVTDAIAHQFAIDLAATVFDEARQYQLGTTAIAAFATASQKTLAAFGTIRWTGIFIATVITTMLVKFGGHALSHLSGQMTSTAKSEGEKSGVVTTPEGKASTINSLEAAPPVMSNANRFNFNERTTAKANTGAKGIGVGMGLGSQNMAFETGRIEGAAAVGTARGKQAFANDISEGDVSGAMNKSEYNQKSTWFGKTEGETSFGKKVLGIRNPSEMATFNATGQYITPQMAQHAQEQGFQGIVPGMSLTQQTFDSSTGQLSKISSSGPVTPENIDALTKIAKASGHNIASQTLKPGMMASYDINPNTGVGSFRASDSTTVQSQDFSETTLPSEGPFTVQTQNGTYELQSGKAQSVGDQVYVNGTTTDGRDISLRGTQTSISKNSDGTIKGIGLNLTKGEVEQGIQHKETLGPEGLTALADQVLAEGGPNHVANALKTLAAGGQSADVSLTKGTAGGTGSISVNSGGTAAQQNFSLSKEGIESVFKAHSSSLTGSRSVNENVSQQIVEDSVKLPESMQMALNKNSKVASFVSDPELATSNPKAFDANVATTARNLATDMNTFFRHQGMDFGHTSEDAGGNIPLPGVVGRVVAGRSQRENETVDLLTSNYDQLIRSSYNEGRNLGLDQQKMAEHITGNISKFTKGIYDKARTSNPDQYGADAIKSKIKEAAEALE